MGHVARFRWPDSIRGRIMMNFGSSMAQSEELGGSKPQSDIVPILRDAK